MVVNVEGRGIQRRKMSLSHRLTVRCSYIQYLKKELWRYKIPERKETERYREEKLRNPWKRQFMSRASESSRETLMEEGGKQGGMQSMSGLVWMRGTHYLRPTGRFHDPKPAESYQGKSQRSREEYVSQKQGLSSAFPLLPSMCSL